MHRNAKKKECYPFDPLHASRIAQSPIVKTQLYLPHVTRRVPRSVHAKIHADWTKFLKKKMMSQSTQNALKRDKMQKKIVFIPLT